MGTKVLSDTLYSLAFSVGLMIGMASVAFAQQTTPLSPTDQVLVPNHDDNVAALLQNAYRKQSRELRFVLADADSTPLSVEPKPVFTWTSLGGWSGDVFV